jgi:hypothetical protein
MEVPMKFMVILTALLVEMSSAQGVMYPLQVGNRWHYKQYIGSWPDSVGYEIRVIGDTTCSNGHTYAIRKWVYVGGSRLEYQRADSERVYEYNSTDSSECILYQFDLHRGDTLCENSYRGKRLDSVFGKQTSVYSFNRFIPGFGEDVADSFGIVAYYGDIDVYDQLTGAVIDGVLYGTVDDVSGEKTVQPAVFQLSQNYPNPFNPVTTIRFSLPHQTHARLQLLDMLGREVMLLKDGTYVPGTYTVQVDGSRLSSGIYFYRLQAGAYSETKRLVLLK